MKSNTSLDKLKKSDPRESDLWETGTLDDIIKKLMEQPEQHDCCHNQPSFPEISQSPSTMSNGSLATSSGFQQLLQVEAGQIHAIEPTSDLPCIFPCNGNHEHHQSHETQGVNDSNIDTGSPLARATSITDTFSCTQCGKTFNRLSNLSAHMLIHSADRPRYKCSYCKDTFGREYDRTRHEDSIHLGIRYPCFCGKSFSRNCNLTKHIKEKHNGGDE